MPRLLARTASGLPLLLAVTLLAPGAGAAAPNDVLVAESLYQSGKQLFDTGKYAEACPKLAESHRLDPAGGTALLLATCWERAGKIALATVAYQDALTLARRDRRPDREKQANERLRALDSEVPRLRIVLSPQASSYGSLLQVTRNGEPLVNAALGVDLLVDPGKHMVRASVVDHEPFEVIIDVAVRDRKQVVIPALTDRQSGAAPSAPTAPAAPATSPAPGPERTATPPASSWRPTAGLVTAGAGVLMLGAGGYFALSARSLQTRADERCPERACGDAEAVKDNDTAHRNATIATVLVPLGAVAVGVGAYLWLSAPAARPSAARWQPVVGPGFAGGSVQGSF